ncbi:hypothetical protein TRVA0_001S03290 [Trichomonascus vanleenenianus]|uniref:NAD(P)-dependent oxidoreductase n=1 Tax=Trichomonascus vanleenenianus TaxID=2268995 RepID=UPI003EC9B632
MEKEQIGFIGLGAMGIEMSVHLQNHLSSHGLKDLLFYNRTAEKGKPLEAVGGVLCTIEEIAQKCSIIFTMLANDTAVREVVEKLIESARDGGKLIIDCSTVHPNTATQLSQLISNSGNTYLASPVFGLKAVAKAANLVFVMAGDQSQIERVRSLIVGVMGKSIMNLGTDHAKALALKITGNSFILGMVELISETQVLGENLGLGLDTIADWAGQWGGPTMGMYFGKSRDGMYVPDKGEVPGFSVDNALKDVNHGIDLAERTNSEVPVLRQMKRNLTEVRESKGNLDVGAVYGLLREKSGHEFENDAVKKRS